MSIYVNGKQIKDIYIQGKGIKFGYVNGHLVFSKQSGWQAGTSCTLTVSSAYSNSIAGSVILNRYDYYEGGIITDSYYEVASKTLSRPDEGVVDLDLGSNAVVVFGDRNANAQYAVPSSGTIRLSASEFFNLYQLRKTNGTLELGRSKTVTSYYVEPIYNMQAFKASDTALSVNAGWTIANNRTSRISLASTLTVELTNLSIPKEGTWPIFAVGASATEGTVSNLTCSVTAHSIYDSQLIRCLGWVTVSAGKITNVSSLATITGAEGGKSVSGTTLTVNNGYWTDTGGFKVYVPSFTYSFSDMVDAAKDKTEEQQVATELASITSASGSATAIASVGQAGPAKVKINGYASGGSPNSTKKIAQLAYTLSGNSNWIYKTFSGVSANWEINLASGQIMDQARAIGSISNSVSGQVFNTRVTVYATVTVQGTTQTRAVYVKVTRNTNNSSKATSVQTTTGTSSPFVSYVYIGSLTVERNADTGSIT